MRRRSIVAGTTAVLIAVLAPPAAAGGWWTSIRIDGPHLGAGETLVVGAEPAFDTIAAAERARTRPYYAYLLSGVDRRMVDRALAVADPGDWWTPPAAAIRAGTVRFRSLDANLARVSARVTVPRVEPGRYSLMLCSAGCEHPLGSVIPAGVIVSPDAALAARSRRLEAARSRWRTEASTTGNRLQAVQERAAELQEDLDAAREAAEEARAEDVTGARSSGGSSGGGVAAGLVTGAAAGLALGAGLGGAVRIRRRRALRSPAASSRPAAARR